MDCFASISVLSTFDFVAEFHDAFDLGVNATFFSILCRKFMVKADNFVQLKKCYAIDYSKIEFQ